VETTVPLNCSQVPADIETRFACKSFACQKSRTCRNWLAPRYQWSKIRLPKSTCSL